MNSLTIKCPQCQAEVSIDDALRHQLQDEISKQLTSDVEAEKKKLREQMVSWQEEEKKKLDLQSKELAEKIKAEVDSESKILKEEIASQEKKLLEAREQELKLRMEKNSLEKEKAEFELEKARQLDAEREKIKEETGKMLLDQYQMKDKEKDKQLDDMRRKIEELQLKSQVTSQQLQGEVLELEMEAILRSEFPFDEILPVPKGVNGADILQKVRNGQGQECGTIVWESKRTKAWSDGWVQKLKDDQRIAKADVAVLVSVVLPEGVKNFGPKDGIYVSNYECLISVAKLIRLSMMQLSLAKVSVVGKNEKMEMIYNYLSGQEFRGRVEAIVEAFSSMKKDLDDEKKVFTRMWAKREKEIERVVNNTIGMHGDLQGMMGTSLPEIPMLEVSALSGDEEE